MKPKTTTHGLTTWFTATFAAEDMSSGKDSAEASTSVSTSEEPTAKTLPPI